MNNTDGHEMKITNPSQPPQSQPPTPSKKFLPAFFETDSIQVRQWFDTTPENIGLFRTVVEVIY